jgi:hypothetical protein
MMPLESKPLGGLMRNRRIFVSCGQETHEEISLGREIIKVIGDHKGMKGFFAQDVHSPADLNGAVFGALRTCDGFFAVMHKRGGVTYRDYPVIHRSSVWIQQEIAIIAYRSFLQGRHVPVRVFQEKGILLEGIMKTSIVNSIVFRQNDEVLEGLSKWLTGPEFAEHPVLARREDLFQRRVEGYGDHHWLVLELIAAHSREPGDVGNNISIRNDFFAIVGEQDKSKTKAELDKLYTDAWSRLLSDGLIKRTDDRGSGITSLQIEKQWWELIIDELGNKGRTV